MGKYGENCMYYFGGVSIFSVDRSAGDSQETENVSGGCISAGAKLVMTNVKFEYFGMQMHSMIEILNGDVELHNVDFNEIIPVSNIYLPQDDTPTDLPENPAMITFPECNDDLNVFYCGSLIYDKGTISKFNDGYSYD